MRYNVDFEIHGMIEVTAENEEAAEDIVEDMNLHELLEDADGVQIDAYANETDEEEMQ